MSVITIYKCDKCEKEQSGINQFWDVGITANSVGRRVGVYDTHNVVEGLKIQVCRPCLESFGIHVQKKPDSETKKTPSIEDLITEIVGIEVQQSLANRSEE